MGQQMRPAKMLKLLESGRRIPVMDGSEQQDVHAALNDEEGKDRISSLPDCILHYILSFLPTKEAVATGILARRWKDLWTAVPILDFDDSKLYSSHVNYWYPAEITRFMNFVERVLLLRDVSNIERFRLSCRVCFSTSRVHAWISAAIRHNVKELDLCFFVDEPFLLPHRVFNCGSLSILNVEMNSIIQLPNSISCPGLKILHLGLVTFPDDISTQRLFSSCPVLEELAILDCDWINMRHISISIPSLRKLIIDDLPTFDSRDYCWGCEIKIDAGSLIFFKYSGYLSNDIHLIEVSSSVKALLHIPMVQEAQNPLMYSRLIKLFLELKNISSLGISGCTIESLFFREKMPNDLPAFQKLTRLELSMQLGVHSGGALMKFLLHLPNLESLNISKGLDPAMYLTEDDWTPKSAAKSFMSSLKTVVLRCFHGNSTEVCLLGYFLKHASSLERMIVFCHKSPLDDSKEQEDMKNELQSHPRVSEYCMIMFF
ncbi:F-box protein At4g22280-like isoform X1 [Coffea arabica]|uniref:F-box protein At4g22280-like isoform X1 n=1 Tax=Coffea arabica TaxID=13443 RepID=A0ABM4UDK6_COFAR